MNFSVAPALLESRAMRVSVPEQAAPEVVIVASSPDTLSSLQSYLRAAGLAACGTDNVEELPRLVRAKVVAFVLFPDDFRWESVIVAIAEASERGRELLPILVTAHPKRFEELTGGRIDHTDDAPPSTTPPRRRTRRRNGGVQRVLIVPRPAWGWTILDVIRAHANRDLGWNTET